jgi:hypothetical protein
MRLVSPDMHSWRRDADRLQAFAGGRFAKVWDDAPARLELTTAVSQAFDAAVRVEDVSGRRLDSVGGECLKEAVTINVERDGRARAIFDFGPHADNPTIPKGSYRLRGTAKPLDDAIDVSLQPDEWIDRPDGYEMVGILGGIDAERRGLRGRILNDSCGWLDVKRTD